MKQQLFGSATKSKTHKLNKESSASQNSIESPVEVELDLKVGINNDALMLGAQRDSLGERNQNVGDGIINQKLLISDDDQMKENTVPGNV